MRSRVCDQVELFAESFFKMPLMRRLEEDMMKIELSTVDMQGYAAKRKKLQADFVANQHGMSEVQECLSILTNFVLKHRSSGTMASISVGEN